MAEYKNTEFKRRGGYASPKGATYVQRNAAKAMTNAEIKPRRISDIPGMTDARRRVYEVFAAARQPLTLSLVARTLGLSASTVHEHVQWLCDEAGVLEDSGSRCYADRYRVL